jgi:hypothetical protein
VAGPGRIGRVEHARHVETGEIATNLTGRQSANHASVSGRCLYNESRNSKPQGIRMRHDGDDGEVRSSARVRLRAAFSNVDHASLATVLCTKYSGHLFGLRRRHCEHTR